MIFGSRDPRKVIEGRIQSKINSKVMNAERQARGSVEKKARGAVKKVANKDGKAAEPAQKKKKRMGWWPFGGKDEAAQAPACQGCSKEVDPSWPLCPYCGTELAKAPAAAAPVPLPNAPPMAGGGLVAASGGGLAPPANRTVAIDIEKLKGSKREVVGWIVAMTGGQKGTDFRIFNGTNSLGAAADNDIVLTDDYLSSKHATIRYEDGKYVFIDHDSTNGSFINEKRVTKEELIDNDTIRVGRTELRFKALY